MSAVKIYRIATELSFVKICISKNSLELEVIVEQDKTNHYRDRFVQAELQHVEGGGGI